MPIRDFKSLKANLNGLAECMLNFLQYMNIADTQAGGGNKITSVVNWNNRKQTRTTDRTNYVSGPFKTSLSLTQAGQHNKRTVLFKFISHKILLLVEMEILPQSA